MRSLVLLPGVVALIVRFRRSGQEQQLQLKWFLYATTIAALVIVVGSQRLDNPLPEFEAVFPLIPAAVGIAILKYRLYEIDRLISRTLAYAIVTGLLVGLYAGLVLLAARVLSECPLPRPSPAPRWWRRPCSAHCGGGCSGSWTGGSTGSATRRRPDSDRVRGPAATRGLKARQYQQSCWPR